MAIDIQVLLFHFHGIFLSKPHRRSRSMGAVSLQEACGKPTALIVHNMFDITMVTTWHLHFSKRCTWSCDHLNKDECRDVRQGVPRVDNSRNPSQNREPNVDPKVYRTQLSLTAMSAFTGLIEYLQHIRVLKKSGQGEPFLE